ncbi:hypothetical protein Fcan01_16016 [Folsomia candida]|uniref:Transposase domain-containing protein n=1 Tax=Folsomia candida TaxID=158441 RepID=A0A226DXG6_FOLCA|nr:hypothetical protein Fcan01_16016 [Folsomia candida]
MSSRKSYKKYFSCSGDSALSNIPQRTRYRKKAAKHTNNNYFWVEVQGLYTGARISRKESSLLILGYSIRHKVSKAALSDILNLINFHLPHGVSIPTSTYLFDKEIGGDYSRIQKVAYCKDCKVEIKEDDSKCGKCQVPTTFSTCLTRGNFFVSFDINKSLQDLLQIQTIQKSLAENLTRRQIGAVSEIRDIMNGDMYHRLGLKDNDISCCINTDGVAIFNSSKYSIWPLLISINELDYQLRRKYTILCGLWFGDEKPNFDIFLAPFIQQAIKLSINGVNWMFKDVKKYSRVYFPLLAADSVARCQLQGISQFNGEHSCPWCLARGESLSLGQGRHKWIFIPSNNNVKRSHQQFCQHLSEFRDTLMGGERITSNYGIKTASKLLMVPKFDIVWGFVFDYMHTVLLGVVRSFTYAWMDSKNHQEPFYIDNKNVEINNMILSLKFPQNCRRHLRETSEMKYWKASEWKLWMLTATHLLKGILPSCYLKHFSKLVNAVYLLCQDIVTDTEIPHTLLKKFCFSIPDLYGDRFCSFNAHLLLHAAECVQNWGPLWSYSLFQFENFNGVLTNSFCGTRQVGMQIVKRTVVTQRLLSTAECSFRNSEAKSLHLSFTENIKHFKKSFTAGCCTVFGTGKLYIFSNNERNKMSRLGCLETQGISYNSCLIAGKYFNTAQRDTKKGVNSVIRSGDQFLSYIR